ncbi:MAG TPA: hypothetical protein VHK65_15070 [Candidatus Dormibacteraeota bacterium]|nr:hypothetical protein [Candidatus Dormibacteraeota bacterium]
MRRKFAWAFPAIFAVSAAASALTAHASVPQLLNQLEAIVVHDVVGLVGSVLSNQSEPVAVTDTVSLVPAALTRDAELIHVGDAVLLMPAVRLTVSEAIRVTDVIPDVTPPTVTLTTKPANPTKSNQATFTWTITDPDNSSGFTSFCKLDTGSFGSCVSGVAYTQLSDGQHTFTVRAADAAGNRSQDVSYAWQVDTTAPTIQCAAPDALWHATDVSLTCTAADSGSGLANPSDATFTLSTSVASGNETANASTGSHQVCDVLNNCATAGPISGIKVDKKPPTITAGAITTTDSQPYVSGAWTNQSVRVSFACTDGGSGVNASTVTPPVTLSADGKDQSVNGSCADLVGNSSSTSVTNIDIDKTPPSISFMGQTPPANAYGWNKTSVTLTWGCTDALSGPVAASVTSAIATEGSNQSATGTCTDLAGNRARAVQGGINIDETAPVLKATATSADGKPYTSGTWTDQTVTVSFSCTDDRSGVATLSSPVTISTEGANQSATGTCMDKAGNAAAPVTFGGIDIDKTPPTTTLTSQPGPLNGRQLVTVTAHVVVNPGAIAFDATCYDSFGINAVFSATDNLAGVTAIKYGFAKVTSGQPLPNPALNTTITGTSGTVPFLTSGAYILNYAAVDQAGNQGATETRWIFVNALFGIGCATTPVPVASLPSSGTVTVSGSIQIGKYHIPFSFSFAYPGRD